MCKKELSETLLGQRRGSELKEHILNRTNLRLLKN